jgi:hypothetical protein
MKLNGICTVSKRPVRQAFTDVWLLWELNPMDWIFPWERALSKA